MWRMLERMAKGEATRDEVDMLMDVTKQIEGHTICAFGEGSSWPRGTFTKSTNSMSFNLLGYIH